MTTPAANQLPFLQELYAQDTLYLLPEDSVNAHQEAPAAEAAPAAGTAAVVQAEAPAVAAEKAVAAPERTQLEEPEEEIKWLGEAVKGTYLLFDVPEETFQQLPQHLFLQKVLAAVGLTTQQVRFGKLSTAVEHDVKKIAAQQQSQHILLFGQGLPVANLNKMEFYRMYRFESSRFVLVDSLADIEKSVELKKKLWDVLQKIFLQA